MTEPLSSDVATKLIHTIIREGSVTFSAHALKELGDDQLTTVDAVNVMRAGAVTERPDLIAHTWRYRIHTQRICVVVAFRSEQELVVVTAWRAKR